MVDNDSPEQDFEARDPSTMDEQVYALALEILENRQKLLLFQKVVSCGILFIVVYSY